MAPLLKWARYTPVRAARVARKRRRQMTQLRAVQAEEQEVFIGGRE
jgi:hypothetical protein